MPSGACTSGSTAHPRGVTRRASGGAATTSTISAEPSRGCRWRNRGTGSMAIILNHTIVPARGKVVSARFFSKIFGLSFDENAVGYFAPVQVNETLTLDFHDDVDRFDIHHYAFHVSDAEFDAIFKRVQIGRASCRERVSIDV